MNYHLLLRSEVHKVVTSIVLRRRHEYSNERKDINNALEEWVGECVGMGLAREKVLDRICGLVEREEEKNPRFSFLVFKKGRSVWLTWKFKPRDFGWVRILVVACNLFSVCIVT
ncbi:hypothetical protein NPIL_19431 [Nephila pilipes]|uniref:Uncharacterized protein n=1 Tax=Nephila pilipes TaxID=299642 RepID=A0A8X6TF80_NEPPI|nr:hypothetical protein NPIL_19431 [Nephila pilipes]